MQPLPLAIVIEVLLMLNVAVGSPPSTRSWPSGREPTIPETLPVAVSVNEQVFLGRMAALAPRLNNREANVYFMMNDCDEDYMKRIREDNEKVENLRG